jgi:DNA uptake protein ComE-like DNA-binding protein
LHLSHCTFVIMYLNTGPIKNWFGFSRRERRATFILLVIIIIIIGVRYLFPDTMIAIEDFSGINLPGEKNGVFLIKDSSKNGKAISSDRHEGAKFRKTLYRRKTSSENKTDIDLNTSDSVLLVTLPGIGPVLSGRIIKYRHLLGGFARVEQLREVYGLAPETYDIIKNRVFADSTKITMISINSAVYKEIIRFPYFEKYEVTSILKYRELKGRITGINDLIDNKLITREKALKVRPYLKFE